MSLVKSWMSRTIALALAIAVVLTGTIQATPAWTVPVTVDTPVVTGNAGVGSTLSVTEGTWRRFDVVSFPYRYVSATQTLTSGDKVADPTLLTRIASINPI